MSDVNEQHRGVVASWNEGRGFGFITPHDAGRDVFVHRTSLLMPEPRRLLEGQEVTFTITTRDGRPRAENVVPLTSETPYRS